MMMLVLCIKAHLSQPKTTSHPQSEAALPTNSSWMQQPWMAPLSTQQQQWMMGQHGPWMMA
jgi:hypothetical protein